MAHFSIESESYTASILNITSFDDESDSQLRRPVELVFMAQLDGEKLMHSYPT